MGHEGQLDHVPDAIVLSVGLVHGNNCPPSPDAELKLTILADECANNKSMLFCTLLPLLPYSVLADGEELGHGVLGRIGLPASRTGTDATRRGPVMNFRCEGGGVCITGGPGGVIAESTEAQSRARDALTGSRRDATEDVTEKYEVTR